MCHLQTAIIPTTRGRKRKAPESSTMSNTRGNNRNAVPVAANEGSDGRGTDLDAVWEDLKSGITQIYQKDFTTNMSKNRYMELYT